MFGLKIVHQFRLNLFSLFTYTFQYLVRKLVICFWIHTSQLIVVRKFNNVQIIDNCFFGFLFVFFLNSVSVERYQCNLFKMQKKCCCLGVFWGFFSARNTRKVIRYFVAVVQLFYKITARLSRSDKHGKCGVCE